MSKFGKLFDEGKKAKAPAKRKGAGAAKKQVAFNRISAPQIVTTGAKRNTPGLKQVSGFIAEDTHKALRKALIDEELDFSELLQQLIEDWLASRDGK